MGDEVRIEYMALGELLKRKHPKNPKDHDLGAIITSMNRFGYVTPGTIDERTGLFAEGHGRLDALASLKDNGGQPPARIERREDDWYIPVYRGVSFNSDYELEAFLIAANRLSEIGGWNESNLAELLKDLAAQDEELLKSTGYDAEDLQGLIDLLAGEGENGAGTEDSTYSRKIEAPTYTPSDQKPPIADLYDDTKTKRLLADIQAAQGLTDEQRDFLTVAAGRHTVLNFAKIADYYAHSDADMQRLMEDSALVIIDFKRAIELGFVTLTERIAALVKDEYDE